MASGNVIVVGHGAAGLSAALTAARLKPAPRVTVIERAPKQHAGGGSRWSPSYMRMDTPDTVASGFVDDVMSESGGRADRPYFERLAREAGPTIAWLREQGVEFHQPPYY